MVSHVVEGQLQTQSLSPVKREGLLELALQRIKWGGRKKEKHPTNLKKIRLKAIY